MGNTPPTPTSPCLINGDRSFQVQIGTSATVYSRGKKVREPWDGLICESWQVSYKVDKSTCKVDLDRPRTINSYPYRWSRLQIDIIDDAYGVSTDSFRVTVFHDDAGHRGHRIWKNTTIPGVMAEAKASFASCTTNALGVITDTRFYFYGSGTRLALIVLEWKIKDGEPCMGTVAHYYANTENGEDVGLSVALKRIRFLDDGGLDFVVDGPEQHPATALLYMFDEVRKTRSWERTFCPHCARNIIQRQRAGILQSESEDNDVDNASAALLRGGHRDNARGLLVNDGTINGNNNANLIVRNLFLLLFRRQ